MPGIAPGAVAGDRIQRVLEGRAQTTRRSLQEVTAEALGNQSLKRFVDPDDIAALSVFLASDRPNRFQGKPSRSTATLKPRSNTSPAPHDLTPPAGDVATAVFVRCGSADVWVSRSRSRAARVSGWVWRTCQAFGRIATERLVACPPRSRTCRWTRSVLCRVTSSTRRTVRVRSRCGVSGLDQSVGKSVAKERIDLSLRSSVRRLLRPRWRVGSPRARFAGPVGRHSSRLPGWRRRAGLSGATAR